MKRSRVALVVAGAIVSAFITNTLFDNPDISVKSEAISTFIIGAPFGIFLALFFYFVYRPALSITISLLRGVGLLAFIAASGLAFRAAFKIAVAGYAITDSFQSNVVPFAVAGLVGAGILAISYNFFVCKLKLRDTLWIIGAGTVAGAVFMYAAEIVQNLFLLSGEEGFLGSFAIWQVAVALAFHRAVQGKIKAITPPVQPSV